MPSKHVKLLERMRKSHSGWKRTDVEKVYLGFGFTISTGGPHDTVSHPEYPELVTSLPRHRRVHAYLVREAVKLIDKPESLRQERMDKRDE